MRIILYLSLLIAALSAGGVPASASAPTFRLGFKALADQIPDVVGQPLENEHYGANGDSLQQTTNGLLAWRKADNWTAFTNGSMTWVNGPYGVQERPNTERFPWEDPASASVPPMMSALANLDAASIAWSSQDAAAETTALAMINQSRRDNGVAPLVMDNTLRSVARADAKDMATRHFFGHVNPDGLQPWDRVRAAGVSYSIMAENIGWTHGFSSPTEGVRANHQEMMAEVPPNDSHRENILNPRLQRVGIGVFTGSDGHVYYVADFVG